MSILIDGSSSVTINSGAVLGITSGTAVASTSGTSIDFTGIPSWVKRITVMFNGVSTNGTSPEMVQLGTSSGVITTGYTGYSAAINAGTGQTSSTSGHLVVTGTSAAASVSGQVVFTTLGGNVWVGSGLSLYTIASGAMAMSASNVTLSGTLDRVRITTVGGTDTFDAGSINILYE
jgi:hypothetical protein